MLTRTIVGMTLAFSLSTALWAEDQPPSWLQFFQRLDGRWTYDVASNGIQGTVRWNLSRDFVLTGRFNRDDGTALWEICGYHADQKLLVINGFGQDGSHWNFEFDQVTPSSVQGKARGVLPGGTAYQGIAQARFTDDNKYQITVKDTADESKVLLSATFIKQAERKPVAKSPWKWLLGTWNCKRSDGTSSKVTWRKPNPDAEFLIGDWTHDDGSKQTEVVGWHPDQQMIVATAFGTEGQYFNAWIGEVSANKLSGWIRVRDAKGKVTRGNLEIERVSEKVVKSKITNDEDGEVVTETFTQVN